MLGVPKGTVGTRLHPTVRRDVVTRLLAEDRDRRDKAATKARTEKLGRRIGDLQPLLYANARHAVLLIFQGMDASGKDGSIRTVLQYVNPAGVQTANFKVPSAEEAAHDFLWRIHRAAPARGEVAIFNRSHYEEVLVVRVHDLVPKSEWSRRYDVINEFERRLHEQGTTILKFFLHIDREEQMRRIRARLDDPAKHWKFSEGDLNERSYWDAYQEAFEDLLARCSPKYAPWFVVPANHKWYRDAAVADIVTEALGEMDPKPSPVKLDVKRLRARLARDGAAG